MPAKIIKKRLTTTKRPVRSASKSTRVVVKGSVKADVQAALSALEQMGTERDRENLTRFGITASKALGVSMANVQVLAKRFGRNHELAAALWDTGWYEARLLTSFVDEPARVTPGQMDRWCRDFDNWGICDTICFHLFDKTPHAWAKVAKWSDSKHEFVKRAAFALLASLALHDKRADDESFARCLPLVEHAAIDERNFVKKGVSWALRLSGDETSRLMPPLWTWPDVYRLPRRQPRAGWGRTRSKSSRALW
jgi:3-methyladenine DNA glycosylase AlkD